MHPSQESISLERAFQLLFEAYHGRLDDDIPLRIKASPIEPVVNCFFVIDQKEFQISVAQSNKRKILPVESSLKKPKLEQNLEQRVQRHLDLETPEALREQSNLRTVRSRGCNLEFEKGLICVKYQGLNGRHTEFWWSPEHNFKYGVAIRSMAKVLRKTRAKDSNGDRSTHERKHGYSGRLFTLVERDYGEMPFNRGARLVSDMVVPGVPSLVNFWEEAKKFGSDRKPETQSLCLTESESYGGPCFPPLERTFSQPVLPGFSANFNLPFYSPTFPWSFPTNLESALLATPQNFSFLYSHLNF